MGIVHSSSRYFGCKREDEDGDEFGRPIHPYVLHCDSPKISSACSSIVNAILQGFRFLFGLVWRRRAANPVLPIQNNSSSSRETKNSDYGRRSQRGIVNVLYYQQEKKQIDHDVVRPVFTFPSSSTVSVPKYAQRNAPAVLENKMGMKSADPKEEEKKKEARVIKSIIDVVSNEKIIKSSLLQTTNTNFGRSSTVSVRKDAPGNVPTVKIGMKSADPEEEAKDRLIKSCSSNSIIDVVSNEKIRKSSLLQTTNSNCNSGRSPQSLEKKLVTSSSTVSVRKDAPGNIPVVKVGKKPDPKEENKVSLIKSSSITIINEKWIKHYSNRHRILLVGEGDFSFSASLALAFSSASNIVATSLNSQEFLKKNYSKAESNIENLRRRQSKVMHEVDATKMANHPSLGHLKFDRIIFNFPYAGLALKNLPRQSQLRSHRRLVDQFLKNAREMLSENGEIHISHKTNGFHVEFKIVATASSHRLRLIEALKFNNLEYPGYNTKFGFGGDNNFDCNPSKTYKFGLKKF